MQCNFIYIAAPINACCIGSYVSLTSFLGWWNHYEAQLWWCPYCFSFFLFWTHTKSEHLWHRPFVGQNSTVANQWEIPSGNLTVCDIEAMAHRNSWFTMIYVKKQMVIFQSNCDRPEGNPVDVRCYQGTSDFLPFLAQNNTLIRNQLLAAPAFLGSSSGDMLKNKTSKRPTSKKGWYAGLIVPGFCDWSIDVSFKVSYPYILCEHHLKNNATLMLKLCEWGHHGTSMP